MSRIVHMGLSVRGALRWSKTQLGRMFRHESGRWMTAQEAHEILCDHLAAGHEVLPMGPCEGFDYVTGCPGHDAIFPTGDPK